MSYNITGWKQRKLYLVLPIDFDFQQWLASQPNSTGKRWLLEDGNSIAVQANLAAQTWELELLGKELSGSIADNILVATSLSGWTGDCSGYLYEDILLPLFKDFKGTLEAIVVWEGGDSIVQLAIHDGVIVEDNVE